MITRSSTLFAFLLLGTAFSATAQTVFINEFHYDNEGTDVGEGVEIIGPMDTSVSGWSIVLYNGSNGEVLDTLFFAGILADECDGFGTAFTGETSLQSGPDGMALVDDMDNVIQFLSYEGSFTATEGPANGMTSEEIPFPAIEGSTTPVGFSVQLVGDGTIYTDFEWVAPRTASFNECNVNQSFGGALPVPANLEIAEIQSAKEVSRYETYDVATADNIVTQLVSNGFYMQTPDNRADGDRLTSDAIFVFTGGAPSVSVGDQVDVTGKVVEFFGATQLSNTSVTVDSSGNALPTPLVLDDTFPSTDPDNPSCGNISADLENNHFECIEGMLVSVSNGTVGSEKTISSFSSVVETKVTATGSRAFRETGIERSLADEPGLPAGLPIFDENPEVFELDVDAFGLTDEILNGGTGFSATGIMTYDFGDYVLAPTSFSITDPNPLPGSVRAVTADEFTIGSLNMFRLFDDIDDPVVDDPTNISTQEYQDRLSEFSGYIRTTLGAPDILAVQEVEKLEVLQDLATKINTDDNSITYTAHLIAGNDIGGIDVGYLVGSRVSNVVVDQLGEEEVLEFNGCDPNTQGSCALLHDRPPLWLQASVNDGTTDVPVNVLVVHMRSLGGITGDDSERVRLKRLTQAQSITQMIENVIGNTDAETTPLVVLGDFNAFQFTDGYVDVVGEIQGDFNPAENALDSATDLTGAIVTDPPLTNAVATLAADQQYSFLFNRNAQALDHALLNELALTYFVEMQYGRGNADASAKDTSDSVGVSDHDGFVVYLSQSLDEIFSNGFED